MVRIEKNTALIIGAGLIIIFAPKILEALTAAIVRGAGSAASNVASGVILGAGDVIGVPRTDTADSIARCQAAKESGDCVAAMTYCPTTDYLAWRWKNDTWTSSVCGSQPTTTDPKIVGSGSTGSW